MNIQLNPDSLVKYWSQTVQQAYFICMEMHFISLDEVQSSNCFIFASGKSELSFEG